MSQKKIQRTKQIKEKRIIISDHAKQRLEERVPWIESHNYKSFVRAARYNGMGEAQIYKQNPEFGRWFSAHYLKNQVNKEVKLYKDLVFVFHNPSKGRGARILKTVMDVPETWLKKLADK